MRDITLILQNTQRFCTLLSNRLPNLKKVSFNICASYDGWIWKPSRIIDRKNKSTKRVVNLIYYLVDHLKQLVSLYITFHDWNLSETPCFPHLIRQQFHQYLPSRPYRLRCSSEMIQIWL